MGFLEGIDGNFTPGSIESSLEVTDVVKSSDYHSSPSHYRFRYWLLVECKFRSLLDAERAEFPPFLKEKIRLFIENESSASQISRMFVSQHSEK